ncbi:hypothetical protein [Variovorax sp. DAIF25]|uniref:hypothetical protein n=1 Tax=Variovorax sp. DAIF25 TaxID=3080983 RepID=UPI003D6BDECC
MSQPAAKQPDMRTAMPMTAAWIERKRLDMGKAHVNDCLRRAIAGEPGRFYALEGGHVLGTPFPPASPVDQWQQYAVVNGVAFAAFIAEPAAVQTPAQERAPC